MIPLIVNEASYITQDKMCGELSLFTGIDKSVICAELERLQNEKANQKHREKEDVVDQMVSEVRRNPTDTKTLLYEAVRKIEEIEEKYDENTFSLETVIQFVEEQRTYEEGLTGEFAGFHLSETGLKGLGDQLNGNWREDVFMCFGGSANAGKTSLCCQLGYEIASIEDNNACVIYHTIDDSKEQILPRFVAQAYGNHDLTMNQIRNPNYYLKNDEQGESILQRRKMGYQELLRLIKDGRIVLKDVNDGTSFAFGENLIRHYQNKFPDRNIVYILDNLHKTPDFGNMEARHRFKALSNRMKDTATKNHVTIISTVEYTKLPPGTIPNNNNIAETRAIIYDASFIGHMYNDMHERGHRAVCMHEHEDQYFPRIRLGVGKNKITDFKGRMFFDMYPSSGLFRWVPTETAEEDMKQKSSEANPSKEPAHFSKESKFGGHDGDQPEMPD